MSAGAAVVGKKPAKSEKSEKRRHNTLVRMDDDICRKARLIAGERKTSMAELFAEVLRPWVDREWTKEVRKLNEEAGR